MNIKIILALLKKELLNIVRDKKTFITMILMPLLMFPLLIGLISVVLTMTLSIDTKIKFGVNYKVSEDFTNFVSSYSEDFEIEIIYDTKKNLEKMFDDGQLGIYVINENDTYKIYYDENSTSQIATSSMIVNLYEDYKEKYIENKLANMGVDYEKIKESFIVEHVHQSVTDMGSFMPSIISMVLIMIISSVCFQLAIEVTTSEKEKGTLETLLSLPVKKIDLITSKFLVVFLLSMASGVLAYISLFGTLLLAKDTIALLGVVSLEIDAMVLLIYLLSIILISLLFSGLLLSVTIFSKNVKEAQNSLIPLELLVTFVSMLPVFGINASLKYALVPFVNIALLFNNVLSSSLDFTFILLTLLSTFTYSLILLFSLSKIYNQEEVLFNTKHLNLLSSKNGTTKSKYFTPFASFIMCAIVLLLSLYLSLVFISASNYFLALITPLTILIVVLTSILIVRFDVINGFKLHKFSFKKFIYSFLLYIGTYLLANEIVNFLAFLFPGAIQNLDAVNSFLTFDNLFLSILIVAISPAIFEELLFRGVVLNSFNIKNKNYLAIIISALIFGVFHMNLLQGAFAFILGLSLGFIYVKTGSLFVPIIIHFINNLFAVLMDYYNFSLPVFSSMSVALITIGAILLVIISIIFLSNKKTIKKSWETLRFIVYLFWGEGLWKKLFYS